MSMPPCHKVHKLGFENFLVSFCNISHLNCFVDGKYSFSSWRSVFLAKVTKEWLWVQVPKAAGPALLIVLPCKPACPATCRMSQQHQTAHYFFFSIPRPPCGWTFRFFVFFPSIATSHQCLGMWWQGGDLRWKSCGDHGSVENHPRCKAIIAGPRSSCPSDTSIQPFSTHHLTELPLSSSIIPSSLVRKLG